MQDLPPIQDQDLVVLLQKFYDWEATTPDAIYLRQPYGQSWKELTYAEVGTAARSMAKALQDMGLRAGDQVGILSKNCYHWVIADLAIMIGQFVSVPFYASLPKDALREVLELSNLKALFVGKLELWGDKINALPDELPLIRFPHYAGNAEIPQGQDWDELIQRTPPLSGQPLPQLDDLWTILFTSGTTGKPKGVMHTYRNPAVIFRIEELTAFTGTLRMRQKKWFSFLPLNHVAERIGVELNCLANGGSMSFAESIDTFAANLKSVQPSFLFAVPRIWIKFHQAVQEKLPPWVLRLLLALPFGRKLLAKAMGLGDLEIAGTGAAITPAHIKQWYHKLGIHLVEAYGMTEVCGSICNGPQAHAPTDSVGSPVPYCEVKVDADTQEILMKSPYQMTGYYQAAEKTTEVLRDGWIYSGDRGTIDEQGFVRVIGRISDAFKTSKGQFIIPNPLEEQLAQNEFVEQVCVVGLGCSQPLALLNLSPNAKQQPTASVEQSLLASLQAINQQLPKYNQLSTLVVDTEPWSEENCVLTPTLKVRRAVLEDRFGTYFEEWGKERKRLTFLSAKES